MTLSEVGIDRRESPGEKILPAVTAEVSSAPRQSRPGLFLGTLVGQVVSECF